jgi:hypothetical protein
MSRIAQRRHKVSWEDFFHALDEFLVGEGFAPVSPMVVSLHSAPNRSGGLAMGGIGIMEE